MGSHKITVEKHDTCIVTLLVCTKQDEGWYEYIPIGNDTATVNIKNADNMIINTFVVVADSGNEDRITIEFPTDMNAGIYTYDIILESAGERHTICDENIFEIKEDSAYAELVQR